MCTVRFFAKISYRSGNYESHKNWPRANIRKTTRRSFRAKLEIDVAEFGELMALLITGVAKLRKVAMLGESAAELEGGCGYVRGGCGYIEGGYGYAGDGYLCFGEGRSDVRGECG